jgi:hypothetical protein
VCYTNGNKEEERDLNRQSRLMSKTRPTYTSGCVEPGENTLTGRLSYLTTGVGGEYAHYGHDWRLSSRAGIS